MKIVEIAVFQLEFPITEGKFHFSGGRVFRSLDATIVRIRTDTGLEGWGESCPFGPNYLPAFAGSARAGISEIALVLIGNDPRNLAEIYTMMDAALYGHPQSKTALDNACWDIFGKATSLPIYQLMGGRFLDDLSGRKGFLSIDLSDATIDCMRTLKNHGMTTFEFKASGDPKTDIEMARFIGAEMETGDVLKSMPIRVGKPMRRLGFRKPCGISRYSLSSLAPLTRNACPFGVPLVGLSVWMSAYSPFMTYYALSPMMP